MALRSCHARPAPLHPPYVWTALPKAAFKFFVILRDFAASAAALPCIGLHRRFIRRTLEAAYSPELRTPMDIYAAALLVGLSCMSATLAACLIVLAIDPKK